MIRFPSQLKIALSALAVFGSFFLCSSAQAVDYVVKHAPYVQLGNAPLPYFGGYQNDQVQIIWQTTPGPGTFTDSFVVEYKLTGAGSWTDAGSISTINTGVESRVNHFVTITGLSYDTDYDYQVRHVRDAATITTFSATYHTRLAPGSSSAFSFTVFGDPAQGPPATNYIGVQTAINATNTAFQLISGDLTLNGTQAELDSLLATTSNSVFANWYPNHITYHALGNHDIVTSSGQATMDNFASPVPVLNTTSPVAAPTGETDEHNYSFNYGSVHFLILDGNANADNTRIDNILNWAVNDIAQASSTPWKIAIIHQPYLTIGPFSPSSYYFQEILRRLKAAGVNATFSGHDHYYGRSYPLYGYNGTTPLYDNSVTNVYQKHVGLTEVVTGTGGQSVVAGSKPAWSPYLITSGTSPAVTYGFTRVDVTPGKLKLSWVRASDSVILDSFTILSMMNTSVSLSSTVVDEVGTATVTFTPTDPIPANGKISVTFPTSLGAGFTFDSGGTTAASNISGMDGTLSASVSSNVITLTRGGSATVSATGSPISFVLSNIKNPNTTGSTGQYSVQTKNSANVILNENAEVAATTITGALGGWWDDAWPYREKITFNNAAQDENLTDVPVMIALNSTRINYGSTLSGGIDLRFTDPDGTALSYEIEDWNSSGTSTIWVKVPQIDASSATDYIYMYYGNSGASDAQASSSVWTNNYEAVWHFAETSGSYLDSTGHGHTSNSIAVGSRVGVLGGIGDHPTFGGGAGTNYITAPDSTGFDIINWTVESYVNAAGAGTTCTSGTGGGGIPTVYPIVSKGMAEAESVAADIHFFTGIKNTFRYVSDFENNRNAPYNGTSQNTPLTGATTLTANGTSWYYLATTIDTSADTFIAYLNGAQDEASSTTYVPNTLGDQPVGIGAATKVAGISADSGGFNGYIDEVRISSQARSADWIAAQYLSLTDDFNTFSAPETAPAGTLTQAGYKWFVNDDSTAVGKGAIQNQPMTAPAQGTPFRLRLLLHAGVDQIAQSATTSLLQFAARSGTCDTGFSGESYTNVSSTTGAIRYYDNSSATDGGALTADARDPKHHGDVVRNQVYSEGSNNFSNSQSAIGADEDGLWDFSLVDYSAAPNTHYCFRAVQAGGGVINSYEVIPEIITYLPMKIKLRNNFVLRKLLLK